MSDADGEASENQVWLEFSRDCEYILAEDCNRLLEGYKEVGRMLGGMISNPQKFLPK